MSSLTMGLIIVGGLVMAAIIAYGAWSARRNTPKHLHNQRKTTVDRVFDTFTPVHSSTENTTLPAYKDLNNTTLLQEEATAAATPLSKRPPLHPLLDCIVSINIPRTVYGGAVVAALPKSWRVGSKPFSIEGLNTKNQVWQAPIVDAQYSMLQAGVQLANRSGALNEIEFSEFVQKIGQFSEPLQGEAEFPDMLKVVNKARDLDQFASKLDLQIGFILRSKGAPWSLDFLDQTAQALGFLPSTLAGRLVFVARPDQTPMLSLIVDMDTALSSTPTVHAFRMVLDVPHVARKFKPFAALCKITQQLAVRLDAMTVDDQGNEIQKEALILIEQDLQALCDTLQSHDIPAGGALALRLFS